MHGEVDEPCRSKVAEYRSLFEEALAPVIGPEVVRCCLASVYESLGVLYPLLNVRVDRDLAVNYPRCGYVVGVYTVCVIDSRCDVVAFLLHLGSCLVKCIPILDEFLNFFRFRYAEDFLGKLSIIDEAGGACLP